MNKKLKNWAENLFLITLFISPIIFFTNVTRNPYLIQERVLQVFTAISILLLLLSVSRNKEIKFPRTFLDWPLLVFLGIALISVILSLLNYREYSASIAGFSGRRMLMFLFSGIIPFYFAAGMNENYFKKIQYSVIAAGTVASLYAILQIMHMDFIWPQVVQPYGQRSISTFGNPNFFSAYILIVIFWIIGNLFKKNNFKIWMILLLINISGLAISMTRSSFMGLFFGVIILLYFLLYKFKNKFNQFKKPIYYILAGIFISTVIFYFSSAQFSQRIKGMVTVKGMGEALTQRLLIWESSLNMFKDTPVIGRGWGNFEIFYPFYQGELIEKAVYGSLRTHANNTHNFLLELLTQVGILGAGVYLLLIVVFIYSAFKIYARVDEEQKMAVLLFTIAGISFWIDNILNVSLYFPMPALAFWLNAGLLAWIGRKTNSFPVKKINISKYYQMSVILLILMVSGVTYFNYKYFNSAMHFFKGFKFSRKGSLLQARDELLECYNRYTLNVDNNYELGNVYARIKGDSNLDKSIWAYEQAIRANPGYDEIYFNLGIMYIRKNKIDKAIVNIEKAIALNPLSADSYRSLGDIKGRQKQFNEAVALYEKAIKINPKDPSLWNNSGYYYEMAGNFEKALKNFHKALEINPSFKQALANIQKFRGKYKLPVDNTKVTHLFSEVEKFVKEKNWKQALILTKEIIQIDPGNLKALLYAGNILFSIGEEDEAIKHYKLILSLDPSNITALTNLKLIQKAQK